MKLYPFIFKTVSFAAKVFISRTWEWIVVVRGNVTQLNELIGCINHFLLVIPGIVMP